MPELESRIADVLPPPVVSFETFPTPGELAVVPFRLAGIAYIERTLGVSPLQTAAFQEALRERPLATLPVVLTAMANQYELIHGQPLRWGAEHVAAMTLEEFGVYTEAILRALLGSTGNKAAEASAGDNGRPTVLPSAKPQRRQVNRSRTSRSTGALSRTDSATNTGGTPETSPT